MFRKKTIYLSLIFSILFTACDAQVTVSTVPKPVRSNWLSDFLSRPVCKLPCWKDITPGVTSIDDARKILLEDPNLKVAKPTKIKYQELEWDFIQDGSGGLLNTGRSQDQVEKIFFYLAKDQWLPLGDLLAVYPSPSSIAFTTSFRIGFCELSLIYESLGMLVLGSEIPCETTEKDGIYNTKIKVTPEILVQGISLYRKEELIEQANMLGGMEWKGLGEYIKEYRP